MTVTSMYSTNGGNSLKIVEEYRENGEKLNAVKDKIRTHAGFLSYETHPKMCELRDENYPELEKIVLDQCLKVNQGSSVQSALTELECQLAESKT